MWEKKAKLSISMRPSLLEEIRDIAEEEGRSVSNIIEYFAAQTLQAVNEGKGRVFLPCRRMHVTFISQPINPPKEKFRLR